MTQTLIFDLSEVFISGLVGVERPLASRLRVAERTVLSALEGQPLQALLCGEITEDQYLGLITRRQKWNIPPEMMKRIIRHHFRHRISGMQSLLYHLAPTHELVLLSDHAREWVNYIRVIHPFLCKFRAQFFSFQLGQTKQNATTFQKVLAMIDRRPEECLFVDDTPQNLESAGILNIPSILFTSADRLREELAARGVLESGVSSLAARGRCPTRGRLHVHD